MQWIKRPLTLGAVLLLLLSGCTQAKFSAREAALSKSVMGGDAEGTLGQAGEGHGIQNPDSSSGEIGQPIQDPADRRLGQPIYDPTDGRLNQPDGTNDEVDFGLICSDRLSEDQVNYKAAVAAGLPMVLALDGKICTDNLMEIKNLVAAKKFTIDDAKRICPALVPAAGQWASVELIIDGKSTPARRGVIELLYARNRDTADPDEVADEQCDDRRSPLVIHVASDPNDPQPIALSSQEDGILFDLLGSKNNHKPVRISWFTNHDYRLLALPNSRGEVKSIDQLFGDSTLGPDGQYSDNGYEALAKYDGRTADGMFQIDRPDGLISPRDPVFNRLRLWLDQNFDGVAQSHELKLLRHARISYIDLRFSTDFSEIDQHGNETKMRSIVGYADGSLDLIFDLWFLVRP